MITATYWHFPKGTGRQDQQDCSGSSSVKRNVMRAEQQRNGTLGSPDKVYLDQRREIASAGCLLRIVRDQDKRWSDKNQGLSLLPGMILPLLLLSQAFVGANDALSSIPQDYYIHFSFHDALHRRTETEEKEDHYGARKWDLATMTYLFQDNPKTSKRQEMHFQQQQQICKETTSGSQPSSQQQPSFQSCLSPTCQTFPRDSDKRFNQHLKQKIRPRSHVCFS